MKRLILFFPATAIFFLSFSLPFTYWPEMLNWPFFLLSGWQPYQDFFMIHTPVLVYLLAGFFKILGQSGQTLHLFGALLLSMTTLLVALGPYWFTKKISAGILSGFLAVLFAVSFKGNHVWFETLLTPLLLLSCLFSLWYLKTERLVLVIFSGVFVALGVLTKQTAVYLLPAILATALLSSRRQRGKVFLYFLVPFVVFGGLFVAWLTLFGLGDDFFVWGGKFVFLKPFLGGEGSFNLWPNPRQAALLAVVFAVGVAVWQKTKSFFVRVPLVWAALSVPFAWPRFDYWHLLPAMTFLALAVGVSWGLEKRRRFFFVAVPTLVGVCLVIFWKNWQYRQTFLEERVLRVAEYLRQNYPRASMFVLNGPDQLYFLTGKLPAAKPWIPQLPWYLVYYGDDKFVFDLEKAKPEVIVFSPYLTCAVDGVGAYRPKGVEDYLHNGYRVRRQFDNNLQIWEKI